MQQNSYKARAASKSEDSFTTEEDFEDQVLEEKAELRQFLNNNNNQKQQEKQRKN